MQKLDFDSREDWRIKKLIICAIKTGAQKFKQRNEKRKKNLFCF